MSSSSTPQSPPLPPISSRFLQSIVASFSSPLSLPLSACMNTGGKPLMNLLQRYQDLGRGGRREWRENPMESLLKIEGEDHVPRGCLAVYVGPHMRRFVIPTAYLGAPAIKVWMDRAAEEYGYDQRDGLRIPCEEEDFEDILRVLGHSITTKKKHNPIVNKLIKFK